MIHIPDLDFFQTQMAQRKNLAEAFDAVTQAVRSTLDCYGEIYTRRSIPEEVNIWLINHARLLHRFAQIRGVGKLSCLLNIFQFKKDDYLVWSIDIAQ